LDPETLEQVRNRAPQAFRTQERAVTAEDYGDKALECDASIQRAVGTFRWTGSWQTVFVTSDRKGGYPVDQSFRDSLDTCLERFRMAGHDLQIDSPQYVSLELAMTVCVKSDYLVGDVQRALLEVLSNRVLPNGKLGVFHPDNFTFGQTVFLSPLYADVEATAGVDSVTITKFQRQGINSEAALEAGMLTLGRLEIARLDNDPNFPERGSVSLTMLGGR
jgi:predicted phage baseplate assembly protein